MAMNLGSQPGSLNSGQTRPSIVEAREHEELVSARRITEIPPTLQMRVEYDGSDRELYIGYGPRGLAASSTGWLIHKCTYTTNLLTLRQTAFDSWDNRATATYA